MGFSDTSIKWRIAVFCQLLAFVFMLTCVCSDNMNAAEIIPNLERHLGFWDICDETMTFACKDLITYLNSVNEDTGWVFAGRTMIMIGIIIQFSTLVLTVYMAYTASSFHFSGLISAIGNGISSIFSLIGGIVFVVQGNALLERILEMDADPSWSFYMFIVSIGFTYISISFHVFEACRVD